MNSLLGSRMATVQVGRGIGCARKISENSQLQRDFLEKITFNQHLKVVEYNVPSSAHSNCGLRLGEHLFYIFHRFVETRASRDPPWSFAHPIPRPICR